MMKKIAFILLIVLAAGTLHAQKAKRTTAYNYLRNNNLAKAMEYIEPTITDESTMGDPKTWYYRGTIYLQIATSEDPDIQALSDNAIEIAYESYSKAKELDEANEYTNDINNNLLVIAQAFYAKGVDYFNQNDFAGAASNLERTFLISKDFGKTDTVSAYYTAYASQVGGDLEKAKEYYNKLIEMNYKKPVIYIQLSEILKSEGDTTGALDLILAGREKMPMDFDLLIAETNIYLQKGDTKNAIQNLEKAIEQDATNPSIFFAVGTNYENMGRFEDAENAYRKAIELDPQYFDAYYNLGALFVNQAAGILDSANTLPLEESEKYEKMKGEAETLLKESIPFLEQALQINPEDKTTIASLKEIYARLNMTDKLNELNEKLK